VPTQPSESPRCVQSAAPQSDRSCEQVPRKLDDIQILGGWVGGSRLTREAKGGSPIVTFLHLDLANHLDNSLQTIFDKT
jgi:hypothetical protein